VSFLYWQHDDVSERNRDPGEEKPYLVLRAPMAWRWKGLFCALVGAVLVVLFAFGESERGSVHIAAVGVAVVLVGAALRTLFLRIEVTHEEVRLVNWLRVLRIPWADVTRFGHDTTVYVDTRRGNFSSAAFSVWRDDIHLRGRAECRRVARRLESARKQRRHEHRNPDR
jgi:hypothetical protein